jgi:DTW domain-containing protein YfiP
VRARPQPAQQNERRCAGCWLHHSLCLCALVPRLEPRTRLVLLVHQLELRKPTNTGRLAARCLAGSEVVVRGGPLPADPSSWASAAAPVLLFPDATAQPLERWRDWPHPVTLIVPDGTWRQAARARHRYPALAAVPCASLPASAPSVYRLRRSVRPGRLSTLEAIARALGVLEGPALEEPLLHIHRVMVDRMLWSNGRLTTAEVTGGVPEGARSHDPLSGPAALRTGADPLAPRAAGADAAPIRRPGR